MKLYNTLTRKVEPFRPISGNRVRIYVCGVTVYDRCHLGHARAIVVFDFLHRFLKSKGYEVDFVRNFTDIDDKIIRRSQEEGISWKELVRKNLEAFREDFKDFGLLPPTHEPRATDHIPEMIELIKKLEERGMAYAVEGEVFFALKRFPSYGKLSGRSVEELLAGARVEVDPRKRDPADFVLWKRSREGEPSWPSPWGAGRPGWHIECSAMSLKYLGAPFDIHGGGADLIFPHHENEIAQSEGGTGRPFARFWLHNGMVTLKEEKMSKSTGNLLNLYPILERYPAEVVRYFLLTAHYRSPLEFSWELLDQAEKAVSRGYETLRNLNRALAEDRLPAKVPEERVFQELWSRFESALDDDLNTPKAFAALFDAIKVLNASLVNPKRGGGSETRPLFEEVQTTLRKIGEVLGVFDKDPEEYLERFKRRELSKRGLTESQIEGEIRRREEARRVKDWKEADRIREALSQQGVILEDTPRGTIWKIG